MAPPGSSGAPLLWPVQLGQGVYRVVSWQVEDDPALGRTVPAQQLAVLCLAGNQPGQRSAFSLEDCQRRGETGSNSQGVGRDKGLSPASALHCLQPGWCQQHVTGTAVSADLGTGEALL